jgi:anthraniloyl-CoA monooxygenase
VGTRYCDQLEPEQFMYSMLTRSQRISHENLRLRDAGWLEGYERWFARAAAARACVRTPDARSPLDVHALRLRGLLVPNRVVVSPMAHVLGRATACPATSTSCTSARARSAARGCSTPR